MSYNKQFIKRVNTTNDFVTKLKSTANIPKLISEEWCADQLLEIIADDEVNYLLDPIVEQLVINDLMVEQLIDAAIQTKYEGSPLISALISSNKFMKPEIKLLTRLHQASKLRSFILTHDIYDKYYTDSDKLECWLDQLESLLLEIEQHGETVIRNYIEESAQKPDFTFLKFTNIIAYSDVVIEYIEDIFADDFELANDLIKYMGRANKIDCQQYQHMLAKEDWILRLKIAINEDDFDNDIPTYISYFESQFPRFVQYDFFISKDYVKVFEHCFGKLTIEDLNNYQAVETESPIYIYKLLYFHALDQSNINIINQLVNLWVDPDLYLLSFTDLSRQEMVEIIKKIGFKSEIKQEEKYLAANSIANLSREQMIDTNDFKAANEVLELIEDSITLVSNPLKQKLLYVDLAIISGHYQQAFKFIEKCKRYSNSFDEIYCELVAYIVGGGVKQAKACYDELIQITPTSEIETYILSFYQLYFEPNVDLKISGYRQLYVQSINQNLIKPNDPYAKMLLKQLCDLDQYQLVVELIGEVEYYHPVQIYGLSKIDKHLAVEKIYQLYNEEFELMYEPEEGSTTLNHIFITKAQVKLDANLKRLEQIDKEVEKMPAVYFKPRCLCANCNLKFHQIESEFRYQF